MSKNRIGVQSYQLGSAKFEGSSGPKELDKDKLLTSKYLHNLTKNQVSVYCQDHFGEDTSGKGKCCQDCHGQVEWQIIFSRGIDEGTCCRHSSVDEKENVPNCHGDDKTVEKDVQVLSGQVLLDQETVAH